MVGSINYFLHLLYCEAGEVGPNVTAEIIAMISVKYIDREKTVS